jgi:hypothetical protein
MPKLSDMMPSNYLKAADCEDDDLVVTIKDVKEEVLGQGADAHTKWILMFREVEKGLVLNTTNIKAIGKLHGDDTDDWIGKRIALHATEVEFKGERMLGIRVRLKAPKADAKPSKAAPEPPPPTRAAVALGSPIKAPVEIQHLLDKHGIEWPYEANTLDAKRDDMSPKDFAALEPHVIPF